MENGDTKKDQRETPRDLSPTAPKAKTGRQTDKANSRNKKPSAKKEKNLRRYWKTAAPLRKLEIVIGAIIATAAVATCFVYVWGNLQAKWISERHPADERAWLSVTAIKGVVLPSPEEVTLKGWAPINYSYVTDNVGKTIAKNVRGRSSYSFGTEPKPPAQFEDEGSASYQTIFPQRPIEAFATRHPIILHRGEDMEWIMGRVHLYLYIFIEYDTLFEPGVRHHTRVCAVWPTPTQQLFCHTGNDAD